MNDSLEVFHNVEHWPLTRRQPLVPGELPHSTCRSLSPTWSELCSSSAPISRSGFSSTFYKIPHTVSLQSWSRRSRVWESLWQPLEVLRSHQEQTPEKLSELVNGNGSVYGNDDTPFQVSFGTTDSKVSQWCFHGNAYCVRVFPWMQWQGQECFHQMTSSGVFSLKEPPRQECG